MSLKIAVYTAVFGGKDLVSEPINFQKNENIDYFLISDNPQIKSKSYKVIYKETIYNDITKNARYYKIIGLDLFKEFNYVIWHDGNIQMNHEEITNLAILSKQSSYAFFKHPVRNCIYDEAIKCIKLEKDSPIKLLKQIFSYYSKNIKNNTGLYATGIYVKNNLYDSTEFMNFWLEETLKYSRRDQISLAYCLKKSKLIPTEISDDIRKNKFSNFNKHEHSEYKFVKRGKGMKFLFFQKKIALKLILLLKKIN